MIISGFNGGTLNGPTNGGYRPPPSNYNAPIVRPAWDEDEDLYDEDDFDDEDESIGFNSGLYKKRRLRIGGWNGAAAQGAAMIISGFNGGQLNGPTNGGYRPPPSNFNAPITRLAYDQDDEEDDSFDFNSGLYKERRLFTHCERCYTFAANRECVKRWCK